MSQFLPYIRNTYLSGPGTTTMTVPAIGEPFEYGTLPFLDDSGNPIETPQATISCFTMLCHIYAGYKFDGDPLCSGTLKMKVRDAGTVVAEFTATFNLEFNSTGANPRALSGLECGISYPSLTAMPGFQNPYLAFNTFGNYYPGLPNSGGTLAFWAPVDNHVLFDYQDAAASTPWYDFPIKTGMEIECTATGFDDVDFDFVDVYGDHHLSNFQFIYSTAFAPIPTFKQNFTPGITNNAIRSDALPGYVYAPGFNTSGSPPQDTAITERGLYYPDGPDWVKMELPVPIVAGQDYEVPLEDGPATLWIYTRDANGTLGWQKLVVEGTSIDTVSSVDYPDGSKIIAEGLGLALRIRRLEPGATEAVLVGNGPAEIVSRPRLTRYPDGTLVMMARKYDTHNVHRYVSRNGGKTWL